MSGKTDTSDRHSRRWIKTHSHVWVLAYLLLLEAQNQPIEGMASVVHVVNNRARATGRAVIGEVFRRAQFSAMTGDTSIDRGWRSRLFSAAPAMKVMDAWAAATEPDRYCTNFGQTHYYNPRRANPRWGKHLKGMRLIGAHLFGYLEGEYGH